MQKLLASASLLLTVLARTPPPRFYMIPDSGPIRIRFRAARKRAFGIWILENATKAVDTRRIDSSTQTNLFEIMIILITRRNVF